MACSGRSAICLLSLVLFRVDVACFCLPRVVTFLPCLGCRYFSCEQGMLLSVGGNGAVEFWQRLMKSVDGEMDAVKNCADDDDDEVRKIGSHPRT